ncbi:MAG: methyltransferase domain-containing protein [Halodesulfurarchaeum sp.]
MYVLEFAGEDDAFAAAEARAAAESVTVLAPGIGRATAVAPDRAAGLAYTRRISELLAETAGGIERAVTALDAASLDRRGSVAVRARDVRGTAEVDTQAAERRLGAVLVERGFSVDLGDPAHTLVALFAGDRAVLGWAVMAPRRDFGAPPTDRPFFQPGSMDPMLARAVCNLARVGPGDLVLDPMCGTGGLLIEAGRLGARPVGFDTQPKMVAGTRENLRSALETTPLVARGDATHLPVRTGRIDAVVVDAPYGRQSKIATHGLEALVRGALTEAGRVSSRAVIVADRPYADLAREAGWTVTDRHDRRVHRSLTRYVHVLRT